MLYRQRSLYGKRKEIFNQETRKLGFREQPMDPQLFRNYNKISWTILIKIATTNCDIYKVDSVWLKNLEYVTKVLRIMSDTILHWKSRTCYNIIPNLKPFNKRSLLTKQSFDIDIKMICENHGLTDTFKSFWSSVTESVVQSCKLMLKRCRFNTSKF